MFDLNNIKKKYFREITGFSFSVTVFLSQGNIGNSSVEM